jgi:2-polyprenyl-3-methyl-5-hydroxy-6-metoxy-1,4-benzoquinol methylase
MDKQAPTRFERQASQYSYPYHWVPRLEADSWYLGRALWWGHEYLAVLTMVRDSILALRAKKVLDLGCGDGRLGHELLKCGVSELVGLDVVERAVAFARAFNSEYGDRASFLCQKVQDLGHHGFDAAVAMETFEHIPDEEITSVVKALSKRLVDEGYLVISVPSMNLPLHVKHERHYTLNMLSDQVAPYFVLHNATYVHRIGPTGNILRRLWLNRFVQLVHPSLAGRVTNAYRRRVWHADSHDGAHIVAVYRRALGAPI